MTNSPWRLKIGFLHPSVGCLKLKGGLLEFAMVPWKILLPTPHSLFLCGLGLPPLQIGLYNRNQPHGQGYPKPGP